MLPEKLRWGGGGHLVVDDAGLLRLGWSSFLFFVPSSTSKVNSPVVCVSPGFCLRASFTHAAIGLVVAHQEERKRLKSERINGRNGQRE